MTARRPDRRQELLGHAAMLAFSGLVAGSFSLGGRIAGDIDPMALTTVRFLLSALVLMALARLSGGLSADAVRGTWRYGVLGLLFGAYFVLMFEGLKTAPPVSASAVFTLTPLMAAGFGWAVMRQRLTRGMAGALVVGSAGALWVVFRGDPAALAALDIGRGEAIYFAGCLCHALYIPMVQRLNRGEGVFTFAFGTMLGGALLLALFGAPRIAATGWADLPGRVWLVLAYLVLFASVATISLLQFASFRLKAAKVMAYTYLTPCFVILWEIGLAGSLPPALIAPGVMLTLLALGILLMEGAQPAAPAQSRSGASGSSSASRKAASR